MKSPLIFHAVAAFLVALTISIPAGFCQDDADPNGTNVNLSRQLTAAGDFMVDGKYDEAADVYRHVLNINSNNSEALSGLGLALGRQFKLDAADEQFDKLLKLEPNNAVAHCGKAMVLLNRLQSSSNSIIKNRTAMLKEAGLECNKAIDADARVVEAHYLLGRVYKEEGRLDRAAQAFGGALKLDPKYSNAYAQLGLVQVLQNKLPEATQSLKKAISINTGNSTAHFGLGQVLLKQNNIDGAIAELTISLYQNKNSAPVHFLMGKAYELQGNLAAAVREYKESIRIKPESPTAYLSIADIDEARGDIEMAIVELHSGLTIVDNEPTLLTRLGTDCLRIDKFDDAIKNFELAAAANPKDPLPVEGLTRALWLKSQREAGGAFFRSNDYEQAEQLIARAISLNPTNIQLKLADAKLRAMSGKSVDLSAIAPPRNDSERPAYAEALLTQGRYADAAEQMNRAISSANNATQIFAVGDLALMIKDLPNAELAYKKAAGFAGQSERSNHGLDLVNKARESARQDLNLAQDLARRRQYASALDKFNASVYQNPYAPDAHLAFAQALERSDDQQGKATRQAMVQYRAYEALSTMLPSREHERIEKHLAKLASKAAKYGSQPGAGSFQRLSVK